MEEAVARWLVSPDAGEFIEQARGLIDPSSLSAGTAMRNRLGPDQAAAVLDLESLRRHGATKLGAIAGRLFLTRNGLEQATRWDVARWRAERIHDLWPKITQVIDAGCGLGIDSLACRLVGLEITGIERDLVTAIFAQANLQLDDTKSTDSTILTAVMEDLDWTHWLANPKTAVFIDPSRRTERGRSWRVDDLQPSWRTIESLLTDAAHGDDSRESIRAPVRSKSAVVVKLAPGFPRHLLPASADITWVSHRGDLVETTLWSYPESTASRQAVVLKPDQTAGIIQEYRLTVGDITPTAGPLGAYVYEPDPAVIRSGGIGALCQLLSAHLVANQVAYLTSDQKVVTPYATGFEIIDSMPFSEKNLRTWASDHHIGIMEIKVRGLDIDPSTLRHRLNLRGKNSTCVILTPTTDSTRALVVSRF